MCLYPRLIKNKRYTETAKNGGIIPTVYDVRVLYVPVGCGNCMECTKQKARQWQVRLLEDIKTNTNGKFITLTFSNEWIKKITQGYTLTNGKKIEGINNLTGYELDNQIATRSVRHFLERWRKKYKKSLRHWLVTEIGHNGTENIHLHGIVWTDKNYKEIKDAWQYGYIYPRNENEIKKNYVNGKTINYIIKYVTKKDEIHKTYKSIILTSAGIGNNYTNRQDSKKNKYNKNKTNETYRTSTGHKIGLPIYWRNKIYTDEERENLWIEKLDKQERWVNGEKISIKDGEKEYYKLLEYHRKINIKLGYGSNKINWKQEEYERQRREMKIGERIKKQEEKEKNRITHEDARR